MMVGEGTVTRGTIVVGGAAPPEEYAGFPIISSVTALLLQDAAKRRIVIVKITASFFISTSVAPVLSHLSSRVVTFITNQYRGKLGRC
jgi:hypothetical protein